MTGKENFFKAHWDWLVAIVGLAALGLAGFYLFSSLGQSPDDAKAECSRWMDSELKKPHKGVDAVDLKDLVIEKSDISDKLKALGEELGVQITIQHTGLFNAMHRI